MNHLLSVPDALGHIILSEFLVLKDIVALDKAYVSHGLRQQYLEVAKGVNEVHPLILENSCDYYRYLCWLVKRSILVTRLILPLNIFFPHSRLEELDLRRHFSMLTDLEITITIGMVIQEKSPYLELLLSHCSSLRSLTLPNGLSRDDSLLRDISEWCPQLETLKFETTQFAFSTIRKLDNWSFPQLRSLHLGYGLLLQALVSATPNLEHLTLNLTLDGGVQYSQGGWTKLKSLHVTGECANDRFLVSLISQNPHLESVHVHSEDTYEAAEADVTNGTLHRIAQHCRDLTKLHLQCNGTNHLGVCNVVQRCKKLTKLSLQYTGQIHNATLFAVAEHCHQLTYLDIHLCTINPSSLVRIATGCESLREIRFTMRNVFKMHKQHQIDYKTMLNMFRDRNVNVLAI